MADRAPIGGSTPDDDVAEATTADSEPAETAAVSENRPSTFSIASDADDELEIADVFADVADDDDDDPDEDEFDVPSFLR